MLLLAFPECPFHSPAYEQQMVGQSADLDGCDDRSNPAEVRMDKSPNNDRVRFSQCDGFRVFCHLYNSIPMLHWHHSCKWVDTHGSKYLIKTIGKVETLLTRSPAYIRWRSFVEYLLAEFVQRWRLECHQIDRYPNERVCRSVVS